MRNFFMCFIFILILEFLNSKLPPVPEEDDMFRNNNLNTNYSDLDLMTPINQINEISKGPIIKAKQDSQQPTISQEEQETSIQNLQYTAKIYTQPQSEQTGVYRNNM